MAHFGAITPKRHVAWANARTVQLLDMGILAKETQQKLSQHERQSTKKYVNRKGKKAYAGTRFLKGTQNLVKNTFGFSFFVLLVFLGMLLVILE